jgi:hypothetical protein
LRGGNAAEAIQTARLGFGRNRQRRKRAWPVAASVRIWCGDASKRDRPMSRSISWRLIAYAAVAIMVLAAVIRDDIEPKDLPAPVAPATQFTD